MQDVALLYYRDPKAESKGFLDGIIDLSLVQQVEKTELPRNFGFSIQTFEYKNIVFSAITDGIRNNWITSLRKAANLGDQVLTTSSSPDNTSSPNPPSLTSRSSSFSDVPLIITTTKIVRSSTSNALIPPKVPVLSKMSMTIPKLTTTPSSSNEQEDDEDSSEYDDDDDDELDEVPNEQEPVGSISDQTTNPEEQESGHHEGILVDLLDTQVDSLKAKLELTQNELYSLHNSNLDLTSQLRQSTSASLSTSSKKYSFTTASSGQMSSGTSLSSSNGGCSQSSYERNSYVANEELAKTKKEMAKQTSEIMSLKNQLSLNQVF